MAFRKSVSTMDSNLEEKLKVQNRLRKTKSFMDREMKKLKKHDPVEYLRRCAEKYKMPASGSNSFEQLSLS